MARRNPLAVPIAHAGPQYRFWGSQKPPEHRDPIRAQVIANDDGEGTAVIRLYDPIDSWGGIWGVSANEFASALDALDSSVTTIELHVNSPGGEVYEGIAILNLLRQHSADVNVIVDSIAASAASFIACGADSLEMAENSQLMIHDAWGIVVGPAADMEQMAGVLNKVSDNIASIYAAKAGGTVADWRGLMLSETWYSADEAVTAGLADSVLTDGDAEEGEAGEPGNGFDLSVFKHQGRDQAPPPPANVADDSPARDGHAARARHLALRERRSA